MSIKVEDVMGRVAITVRENASFADIVAAMKRYAVGSVTVIDADRRPVGIVSEEDLLLKEIVPLRRTALIESRGRRRERDKAVAATAAGLMTTPALTVTPGTAVRDAARLMRDKRVKQLPVIDPVTGRVAGTLHQQDVLRVFTRPAADIEAEVDALLPEPAAFWVGIDQGVVTVRGTVEWSSQAVDLIEAIRQVEGVVDVVSELSYDKEDLLVVPPLF
jgi:CBS domain-containing protein